MPQFTVFCFQSDAIESHTMFRMWAIDQMLTIGHGYPDMTVTLSRQHNTNLLIQV